MQVPKVIFALLLMMSLSLYAANPTESIDIVSMSDKPIVKAYLNGEEAFFLLDTGASISIFNTQSAPAYRFSVRTLPDMWAVHSISVNGEIRRLEAVDAVKLLLGQVRIRGRWFGSDLSALTRSIQKKTGIRIVGIIGFDVMKKYGFQIDIAAKKVHLTDPSNQTEPDAHSPDAAPVPLQTLADPDGEKSSPPKIESKQ